jgi:hypothetical protein
MLINGQARVTAIMSDIDSKFDQSLTIFDFLFFSTCHVIRNLS